MARTPDDIRKESYGFWTGAIPGVIRPYRPVPAVAICSMQNGETSYRWPFPIGDHGHAHGGFQWQQIRRQQILENTRIDVFDPELSNLDCCKAADWEMTNSHAYRQIRPILECLQTLEACVAILVSLYEQSANKPQDIVRRYNLAIADAGHLGIGVMI
jgi:hypothetical protein